MTSDTPKRDDRRTILWTPWGPHLWHDGRSLVVEDINPTIRTRWRLTRGEMLRMAWGLARVALTSKEPNNDQ